MHNAFWMNLVQAQKQISCDDLNVAQVESFSTIYQVFEKIWCFRWKLELFDLLYFLQNSIFVVLWSLCLNFGHKGATNHTCGLLGDEEKHVCRLVHIFNLAHINRLLKFRQCKSLSQDKLLLLFVKLRLLNCCQRIYLREVSDLTLLIFHRDTVLWNTILQLIAGLILRNLWTRFYFWQWNLTLQPATTFIFTFWLRCPHIVWRPFSFFLSFLLNLDPEVVTVGGSLHHLKDSVLYLNALLRHENETGIGTRGHLLAKRPTSALNGGLDTIVVTGAVERDGATETHTVTLPIVGLIVDQPAWLLAWKVVTQFITVSFNLNEVLMCVCNFLLRDRFNYPLLFLLSSVDHNQFNFFFLLLLWFCINDIIGFLCLFLVFELFLYHSFFYHSFFTFFLSFRSWPFIYYHILKWKSRTVGKLSFLNLIYRLLLFTFTTNRLLRQMFTLYWQVAEFFELWHHLFFFLATKWGVWGALCITLISFWSSRLLHPNIVLRLRRWRFRSVNFLARLQNNYFIFKNLAIVFVCFTLN